MAQEKILGTSLVAFLVVALAALGVHRSVTSTLDAKSDQHLEQASQALSLTNRLHEYALLHSATAIAHEDALLHAVQCPVTADALRELQREQTPLLDPATGQPVRDALGRPLDTEGRAITEVRRPLCTRTQHDATLRFLRQYFEGLRAAFEVNRGQLLPERSFGLSVPRVPDLIVVSDASGTVIARLGHDRDEWYGPSRNMNIYPITGLAATLGPQVGFIGWREAEGERAQMARVAVVPIEGAAVGNERPFLGTLMLGYLLSNDFAKEDAEYALRSDVAYYLVDGSQTQLSGSDFTRHPRLNTMLATAVFARDGQERSLSEVLRSGRGVFTTDIEGVALRVVPVRMNNAEQDGVLAAALVLVSQGEALRAAAPIRAVFPLLSFFLFLIVVIVVVASFRDFKKPIEDIAKGIQEVIAGNKEYMWPVDEKSHLADMAHQLNIMSAILQGKRPPDTAEEGENWGGGEGASEGMNGGSEDKPRAVRGLGGLRGRSAATTPDDAGTT